MKANYFNEQGVEGFTSITNKDRLSECLYQAYRIFTIKEASNNVDDFLGISKLRESKNLEDKFCIGSWLYNDDGKLFIMPCELNTPPDHWPRHVNIINKYKDELGVRVTEKNKYEINRIFKRGFNYYNNDKNVYVIMAGDTFKESDLPDVLAAFNVPVNIDYIVRRTFALDPVEISSEYLED